MSEFTKEVQMIRFMYIFLWGFIVLLVLVIGNKNKKVGNFKYNMLSNWKESFVISIISYISFIIGFGDISYVNNIFLPIAIFCQCLIGLTIAKSIHGYEPLPVTKAIKEYKAPWRKFILMLVFSILLAFLSVFIGQIGKSISLQLFGEVDSSSQVLNMLPQKKWLLFFLLLSGAGIAEETVYRLIFLSLFLKITKKPWLSVILSSLLFAFYHLMPINDMYTLYLQYPISQFVSVTLSGMVFGYFYLKRGYETAVLGHTLRDWLPIMIFMK